MQKTIIKALIASYLHVALRLFKSFFFCLLFIHLLVNSTTAQAPANFNSLGKLPPVQIPVPATFTVPPFKTIIPQSGTPFSSSLPGFDDAIQAQNRALLQEHDILAGEQTSTPSSQSAALEALLSEDDFGPKYSAREIATRYYRKAFQDLSMLNPDHFSIIRAQYDIENAYLDGEMPYSNFQRGIQMRADHVRQILQRDGVKANNDLALNYGIQQLYQHPNIYYDSAGKKTITVPPITYQFEDYEGKKDFENIFTEKLMRTGKGQCLSMPRLYLMIAEQLGAKVWLSLAPRHSFIQFKEAHGNLLAFETTNGHITSAARVASSGYINAKALSNKTYLDTLSQRQLYAECIIEMLIGYTQKFGYDDFAEQMRQRAVQIDPNNIRAWIIFANVKTRDAIEKIVAVGKPKPADLPKYPEAYQAYQEMIAASQRVEDLGYQDMPAEAYKKWLQSIEKEKNQQACRTLNDQMRRQIQHLQLRKSTLQIQPSKR